MKKRINLFKKIDSFALLDEKLKRVNYYLILSATAFFVIFLLLFGYNYYLTSQVNTLSRQKQLISQQLAQKDTQFKINYISNKTDQIKQYEKDDVHFTTYYNLIVKTLAQQSSPTFTTFKIDNKQNVEIGFTVNTYGEMQNVMSSIESDAFLNLFKSLKIDSAMYTSSGSQSRTTLQFSGVMKHVDTEI